MLPRPNPREIDRRARLAMSATPIPCQEPSKRTANFDEVYLPFDEETARVEARRCIQCPNAVCTKACPLQNDIPLALWQLEHGNLEHAAEVFHRTSTMPDTDRPSCFLGGSAFRFIFLKCHTNRHPRLTPLVVAPSRS